MTPEQYSSAALARAEARHAAADGIIYNSAGFAWNGRKFLVTVRDSIVGEFATMAEVERFVDMHNGRING